MPTSTILRATFFALGAAVGGGAVAVLNASSRKKGAVPIAAIPPSSISTQVNSNKVSVPLEVDITRDPTTISPILRYGSPGTPCSLYSNLFLLCCFDLTSKPCVGPISDLLARQAYVAAYDRRMRHPAWTAEHLTLASLGKSTLQSTQGSGETGDRGKSAFHEDDSLPAQFRAKLQDYFRSGYDRGHMVPAADAKRSQEAMDETFLLSNIAPQVGSGFNRHYWAYLEDWCRRLTNSFSDVYVFTIPLYLPRKDSDGKWRVTYEVIGNPPNIAVPTHFAKVVLASRPSSPSTPHVPEISTGAFVLPNAIIPDEASLESFVVPVDAVERAAGLTLFSDAIKGGSNHICKTTKCEVIVRRFDDAQKRSETKRAISSPR
ncbi:hypothetical protein B0F90DRAFT_1623624 [Multifurca ochricompacta]|uniref:Endonuclease n=1 Tax=Multifurca ochricompacta TaxID=376703 RepID=A0AAD4QS10_9AGAM|nr:hypothetical protein B0F90DRAFT_1623624 [Multifurca ochricompacta]